MERTRQLLIESILYTFIVIGIVLIPLSVIAGHTTTEAITTEKIVNQKQVEVEDLVHIQPKNFKVSTVEKVLTGKELINKYVEDIASKYKLDPNLIKSLIYQESRYNPNAKNGTCLGLMQISTRWHRTRADKLGVKNFYDSYGNILLGVDYLSELFVKYKDPKLVLMLYNMDHKTAFRMYSEGRVSKYATAVLKRAEQYRKGE